MSRCTMDKWQTVHADQLAERVVEGRGGKVEVEPGETVAQLALQHDRAVIRALRTGRIGARPGLWPTTQLRLSSNSRTAASTLNMLNVTQRPRRWRRGTP